jgi:hypothetical protein
MFTLFLTSMMTSFSMAAGGGAPGTDDGIARRTIVQVGATMKERHPFIEVYPRVGGMITGSVVGEDISGTTSEYPTRKFSETGKAGKGTDIGKNKIIGVSGI